MSNQAAEFFKDINNYQFSENDVFAELRLGDGTIVKAELVQMYNWNVYINGELKYHSKPFEAMDDNDELDHNMPLPDLQEGNLVGIIEAVNNGTSQMSKLDQVVEYFNDSSNYDLDRLEAVLKLADGSVLRAQLRWQNDGEYSWDLFGNVMRIHHGTPMKLGKLDWAERDLEEMTLAEFNTIPKIDLAEVPFFSRKVRDHGGPAI